MTCAAHIQPGPPMRSCWRRSLGLIVLLDPLFEPRALKAAKRRRIHTRVGGSGRMALEAQLAGIGWIGQGSLEAEGRQDPGLACHR